MARYKVVVINPGYESYDIERSLLEPVGAEVLVAESDCDTEDRVIATAKEADAILVREGPVTRRVIESLDRLKVIARYGVGVDNVDLETARQRKIYACIVPNYGNEDVSDHAMALLLACIRTLSVRDRNVRNGIFETDIVAEIHRTTGRNLGIIGYGKIARVFHRKWQGFLPDRVLIYDPFVDGATIAQAGAEKVELDTLLETADYISIHAPLTPKTRHLIDAAAMKKMKSTAIIVNTSRGAIIDTVALAQALADGEIFAAGIDVFEKEPLPVDHPLAAIPNAILTPHLAWYSKESTRDLQTGAAMEVKRVLAGEQPQNWINRW
ncbi:MAG: C-terminal binding protein [Desulfobacterales bacterium]|nr:C-terminal binding protein [Desulfobacterales bacterium]